MGVDKRGEGTTWGVESHHEGVRVYAGMLAQTAGSHTGWGGHEGGRARVGMTLCVCVCARAHATCKFAFACCKPCEYALM